MNYCPRTKFPGVYYLIVQACTHHVQYRYYINFNSVYKEQFSVLVIVQITNSRSQVSIAAGQSLACFLTLSLACISGELGRNLGWRT